MAGKSRKWLAVTVLACVLLVLGLAGAGYLATRQPAFQRWLAEQVSDRLGPGVRIGAASLDFWPAPAVVLRKVKVESKGDPGREVAGAERVRCSVSLLPLLRGRLRIDGISLQRPRLVIERKADGAFALAGAEGALLPAQAGRGRREDFELPRLTVRDGRLVVLNRHGRGEPRTYELADLDLDVGEMRRGRRADFRLAAQVERGGRVELRGAVDWRSRDKSWRQAAVRAQVRVTAVSASLLLPHVLPGGVHGAEGAISGTVSLSGNAAGGFAGETAATLADGSFDWLGMHFEGPVKFSGTVEGRSGAVRLSQARARVSRLRFRPSTQRT